MTNRYSQLTQTSKNDIVQVSCGIETSTGRKVIIRTFSKLGIYIGYKDAHASTLLAECDFAVGFLERIDVPEKNTGRSSYDPGMIVVTEELDTDLAFFQKEKYRDGFDVHCVKSIGYQLLLALMIAHMNCIIIRDLHPANIRICEAEFRVKISNFGASKLLNYAKNDDCIPLENLQMSDLRYQAPEILLSSSKNSEYTKAIDLWSLGCILGIS